MKLIIRSKDKTFIEIQNIKEKGTVEKLHNLKKSLTGEKVLNVTFEKENQFVNGLTYGSMKYLVDTNPEDSTLTITITETNKNGQ